MLIPMLEPRRAGLQTSRGSGNPPEKSRMAASTAEGSAAYSPARTSSQGSTGSSSEPHTRLKSALSMPTAEAAGPAPQ